MIENVWTEKELQILRDMRKRGATYAQIAKATGRTREACTSKADRLGLPRITKGRSLGVSRFHNRADDERDLNLLDELAEGAPITSAAKRHGVSLGHAQRLIRDYWDGEAHE